MPEDDRSMTNSHKLSHFYDASRSTTGHRCAHMAGRFDCVRRETSYHRCAYL